MLKGILIGVVCLLIGFFAGYASQNKAREDAKYYEKRADYWKEQVWQSVKLNDSLCKTVSMVIDQIDIIDSLVTKK